MNKLKLIFLSLLVFSIGCESIEDQNIAAIEAELLQVLDRDDALGIDGLDDQNAMESDYDEGMELDGGLAKMAIDTLWPGGEYRIRLGRRILDHNREVEFVIEGDTAIGHISFSVDGEFRILAIDTSTHEVADSVVKPFTSVFSRKVRFVQHETPNNPDSSAWRIDAFTMGMGGAGSKVSISSMNIYGVDFQNDWETGELLYSFNADEAGDLFLSREELPTFFFRQPIVLEVEVENLGPEFPQGSSEWTHFHYARNRWMKGRRHLNDAGRYPDVTENDNTFSTIWRVHGPGWGHNHRIFRGFFDVLDMSSVFVEDEDVHTAVWWLPYRVSRP